jgi:membrane protein DedA with SNARE-associated domain
VESVVEIVRQFWVDLQNGQVLELGYWTYVVLALCNMVQGPLATLLGAAAASAGLLRPSLVFIASVTGHLAADMIWYWAGHAGKIEWLQRLLPAFSKQLDRLQQGMHQNVGRILLLAKFTSGFAVPALIAAGLTRAAWRRCFPAVFVGEVLWTGVLMFIGYYATEAIIRGTDWGILYFVIGLSVILFLVIFWAIPRALRESQQLSKLAIDDNGKLEASKYEQ